MQNHDTISSFSSTQFLCYLLFYAAKSDNVLDAEEIKGIKEEIQIVESSEAEVDQIMSSVQEVFNTQDKKEHEAVINMYAPQFLNTEQKKEVALNAVENIIVADFNIDINELETYKFLKRILAVD